MSEHTLWSSSNALFFLFFIIIFTLIAIYSLKRIADFKNIKRNWAKYRCNPTIMPFVSFFGYNTAENFQFCMGEIFQTHASSYVGSFGTMMGGVTGLLQTMFGSINSLRNTVATLGGGINVVFQEFTDRISMFFFRLRISAIQIKNLIGRMYAILFSVMYMGLSGITGMTSFTNTFLFGFLDTFCFPGETKIMVLDKGLIPIKDIKINDVLLPTNSKVTGTFRFYSKGQPMVKLGSTIVSTNHYIEYKDKLIKAGQHPEAISIGNWNSDEPLYCLDTNNNRIPVEEHIFLDYDETSSADKETMMYIKNRLNAEKISEETNNDYKFVEYCPCIGEGTVIKLKNGTKKASDIIIGDELNTGSRVVGLIRRKITEYCIINSSIITPSTLFWDESKQIWTRIGEKYTILNGEIEMVSFIVVPNSQLEMENGLRIRDYMELCSPDSEIYYTKHLESKN